MKDETTDPPVRVFACGPEVCVDLGGHKWGVELVQLDQHTASIVCIKCGMPKVDWDMWSE